MDHGSNPTHAKQETEYNSSFDPYIVEEGKSYMVPYHMIKKVTMTNVSRKELIDIPHAARLQYRLMLMDPVIKATVDYTKAKITIIYNPKDADNNKEKISIEDLLEFLHKEGVNATPGSYEISDYDYYANLYSYAYRPAKIRERAPYGYTMEQWEKLRPEWESKMGRVAVEKREKFKEFQNVYLQSHEEMAHVIDKSYVKGASPKEKKSGIVARIFGKKKGPESGGKGFWFHGI